MVQILLHMFPYFELLIQFRINKLIRQIWRLTSKFYKLLNVKLTMNLTWMYWLIQYVLYVQKSSNIRGPHIFPGKDKKWFLKLSWIELGTLLKSNRSQIKLKQCQNTRPNRSDVLLTFTCHLSLGSPTYFPRKKKGSFFAQKK